MTTDLAGLERLAIEAERAGFARLAATIRQHAAEEREKLKTGIAPGTKLPNGATVLLSAGPGAGDYCVVLAEWGEGKHHEYITWRVEPNTLEAFWGDYYKSLPEACESFLARGFSYGTSRFEAA